MSVLTLILIGALGALAAEAFVRTTGSPQYSWQGKGAAFFILTPMIGALAALSVLAFVPWPFLAATICLSALAVLVIISNTKLAVLRQVYAAQDVENIRHMVMYPTFYLVHLGTARTVAGALLLGVIAALLIAFDTPRLLPVEGVPPVARWGLGLLAWWGGYRVLMALASLIVREDRRDRLGLTGDPNRDTARFGLFATILLHSLLIRDRRHLRPLSYRYARHLSQPETLKPPHIIAVQAESYMDLGRVDRLCGGPQDWPSLERLRQQGTVTGKLDVPAWGAYTMQTEMGFLSTIPHADYRTSGINPYLSLASRQKVWSLAAALKAHGYRTLCLHPAKRGFFRRADVMPNLGFDDFITLEAFQDAPRFGPYVSDAALGDHIKLLMDESDQPLFIQAVTIESHGPWLPGRLDNTPVKETDLMASEPTDDLAFALYRQHMENVVRLAEDLLTAGTKGQPVAMALYGDHQPTHGPLFERLGLDDPAVDYLLAHSHQPPLARISGGPKCVTELGPDLLRLAGFDISAISGAATKEQQ